MLYLLATDPNAVSQTGLRFMGLLGLIVVLGVLGILIIVLLMVAWRRYQHRLHRQRVTPEGDDAQAAVDPWASAAERLPEFPYLTPREREEREQAEKQAADQPDYGADLPYADYEQAEEIDLDEEMEADEDGEEDESFDTGSGWVEPDDDEEEDDEGDDDDPDAPDDDLFSGGEPPKRF